MLNNQQHSKTAEAPVAEVVPVAEFKHIETFFELERKRNTREEHAELCVCDSCASQLDTVACRCKSHFGPERPIFSETRQSLTLFGPCSCEAVLRDPVNFQSVPIFYTVPELPLDDIYPKVIGSYEGMFPFVVMLQHPMNGEQLTACLKARFKESKWYLKQNTNFAQLSNCSVERSTFQIVNRGDSRSQYKISLYVSKLLGRDDRYILEFRRSGRDVKEVPSEFLHVRRVPTHPMSRSTGTNPVALLMPSARQQQVSFLQTKCRSDFGYEDVSRTLDNWFYNNNAPYLEIDMGPGVVDHATAAVYQHAIQSVEASAIESPRKRLKLSSEVEEDLPKALWWDLQPVDEGMTSSFEALISTILFESRMEPRSYSMQDTFDCLCLAFCKNHGHRISLLVLENADLLMQDMSVYGRWKTLQKCLNSSMSSTKIILLTNNHIQDFLWINPAAVMKVPLVAELSDNDATTSRSGSSTPVPMDDSSDWSSSTSALSHSAPDSDCGMAMDLDWSDSKPMEHPSLQEIFENFSSPKKRKYDALMDCPVRPLVSEELDSERMGFALGSRNFVPERSVYGFM